MKIVKAPLVDVLEHKQNLSEILLEREDQLRAALRDVAKDKNWLTFGMSAIALKKLGLDDGGLVKQHGKDLHEAFLLEDSSIIKAKYIHMQKYLGLDTDRLDLKLTQSLLKHVNLSLSKNDWQSFSDETVILTDLGLVVKGFGDYYKKQITGELNKLLISVDLGDAIHLGESMKKMGFSTDSLRGHRRRCLTYTQKQIDDGRPHVFLWHMAALKELGFLNPTNESSKKDLLPPLRDFR